MTNKKRLLKTVVPHWDESLIGYITRLTEINDYDTPSWIMQLADMGPLLSDASFTFKSSLNLLPLATLAGVEAEKLAALKYEPTDLSREKFSDCLVFGVRVPKYIIRPNRPKVCPECLRDFGYLRRVWELTPVTSCPIHKRLLLQECPNCSRPFSWLRNKVGSCRCGCEWRGCSSTPVNDLELKVTRHIHDLCGLPTGDKKNRLKRVDDNPIYKVDLQHFLTALLLVGGQELGFTDTRGIYLNHLNNAEIQEYLSGALLTFNDWPEGFYSFLDMLRTRAKGKGHTGIQRDFDKLDHALYGTFQSRHFDFMRSAFDEYLLTRWDGGHVSNIGRFKKGMGHRSKYLSRTEATAILGVANAAIDLHLASGRLQGKVHTNRNSKRYLIERDSVLKLKCELEQTFNLKHISLMLGSHPKRILELVDAGMLKPISGPTLDGFGDWIFSVGESKELLEQIRKRIPKSISSKIQMTVDFLKATPRIGFMGGSFPQFIKDMVDGIICPCSENLKEIGFRKFLFSERELSSYLLKLSRDKVKDAYWVGELTAKLGLTEQSIYSLIARGILTASAKPYRPHFKKLVTREDVESFNSKYVVLAKLIPELGTDAGFLARHLIREGIHPVSGGQEDGGRYVFKRSDLELINVANLVSEARKKAALKRKEPQVIDLVQAAEMLSVNTETLQQLVENEIITIYGKRQQNKKQHGQPQFSIFTIKKYVGWVRDYIGLVTAKVAARMLNMSTSNFMEIYSRRNRITALNPKGRPKPLYFRKKEVEILAEQKRQTITAPEAAEVFGVNISCIHKMKKSGHLKPVSGPDVDGFGLTLYLRGDIERIRGEREAFKLQRIREGKAARFGHAPRPYPCPIQEMIKPRIEQMFKEWQARPAPKENITGADILRQLNKEGRQVSSTTVYMYLRRRARHGTVQEGTVKSYPKHHLRSPI